MPDRSQTPEVWTSEGLLDHVREVIDGMPDRSFAFVLGAGASIPSGIPGAGALAEEWLGTLQRRRDPRFGERSPVEWARESLGIKDFEGSRIAEFYPTIYDERFKDRDSGQAMLEKLMSSASVSPSVGYSILAQILAGGRHNAVITTNFDHLVSDALFLFTTTEPFVVGHEDLTDFIRPNMRRPLVAKIHRDLFLRPMNAPQDIRNLTGNWAQALKSLFSKYTPIVIGYGGNDGTLMGLLAEMSHEDISGRMIWCYREQDGSPRASVLETLDRLHGILVPILGFDEIMLQLGELLGLPIVAHQLEEVARQRGKRLGHEVGAIRERLLEQVKEGKRDDAKSVLDALDRGIEVQVEMKPDWWAWELKARAAESARERSAHFEEAVKQFPRSPELAAGLGRSLLQQGREAEAEEWMRRAHSMDPSLDHQLAWLLARIQSADLDEVKTLFERAIEREPESVRVLTDFADFERQKGSPADAAQKYRRAVELDPECPQALLGLAIMCLRSGKFDEAEGYARQAWEFGPKSNDYLSARIAFVLAMGEEARGDEERPALGRLKWIHEAGYEPDCLYEWWLEVSPPGFLSKLLEVIANPTSTGAVSSIAEWGLVEPIPPGDPWPAREPEADVA